LIERIMANFALRVRNDLKIVTLSGTAVSIIYPKFCVPAVQFW
jgi:hypothetical protein